MIQQSESGCNTGSDWLRPQGLVGWEALPFIHQDLWGLGAHGVLKIEALLFNTWPGHGG